MALRTPPFIMPSVNMNNPMKNKMVDQSILLMISLLLLETRIRIDEVVREPRTMSIPRKLSEKNKTTVIPSRARDV